MPKNTVVAITTAIPQTGGMNVSKHVPAELNPGQIGLAARQAAKIAMR